MNALPPELIQLTLEYLDDIDLARACIVDKRMYERVCNNTFWINKISNRFNLSVEEMSKYKGLKSYAEYYFYLYKKFNQRKPFLIDAIKNRRIDLVKIALRRGETIDNVFGYTPLEWAGISGQTEVIKLLLESGVNVHDNNDRALILASENGHVEAVKILIENGANVHAQNDRSLIRSSVFGHTRVVEVLLQSGADAHAEGDSALILAREHGNKKTVEVLLRY